MRIALLFIFVSFYNLIFAQILSEKVLDYCANECEYEATFLSKHPFIHDNYVALMKSDCPNIQNQDWASMIVSWLDYDLDTVRVDGGNFRKAWISEYGNPVDQSFFVILSQPDYVTSDSLYVGNLSMVYGPQNYIAFKPTNCSFEETDYFSSLDGNIVTMNYKQGNCGNYKDALITSWDYNYNVKWEYRYEGVRNDEIYSIKSLNDKNLLALGHSNSKSVKTNLFLLKLDSNGMFMNTYVIGDTINHTLSNDMEIDSSGNIYIVWNKHNQLNITKLNSSLEAQWDLPLNTYGLEDIEIQFSKNDNSLILISNGLNPFTSDFEQLVHKIDVNGNIVWKRMFDERISDFIIKSNGSFLLYGDDNASDFTQIIHFDSTFAYYTPKDSSFNPNSDSSDVQPVGIADLNLHESLNIYPNPFSDFITINSEQLKIKNYSVYNLMGQLVQRREVNTTNKKVSFEQNVSGAYILQVELEDGSVKTEKIIYSK